MAARTLTNLTRDLSLRRRVIKIRRGRVARGPVPRLDRVPPAGRQHEGVARGQLHAQERHAVRGLAVLEHQRLAVSLALGRL